MKLMNLHINTFLLNMNGNNAINFIDPNEMDCKFDTFFIESWKNK